MNRLFAAPLLLAAALLAPGCSDRYSGGGGVDTETSGGRLTGIILQEGAPAARVTVHVYPGNFNPVTDTLPDSLITLTGSRGEYRLDKIRPGSYNILATLAEPSLRGLRQGLVMPAAPGSHIQVPALALTKASSIVIRHMHAFFEAGGQLYIPGSDIRSVVTADSLRAGTVTLHGVSAADYGSILYAPPGGAQAANLLQEPLRVPADTVVTLGPFSGAGDTLKLLLNTTDSGIGIAEDLLGLPVLVRLDGTLEPSLFSDSASPDLRFTKSDGVTLLPFEIERWDRAAAQAEVWVRLDTLRGNNGTQHIFMQWGRPVTDSLPPSPAVFDTVAGYLSVWHLEEAGNNIAGGYRDATPARNDGTGIGWTASASVPAAAGKGLQFAGDSCGITAKTPAYLTGDVSFTLSFWLKTSIPVQRSWMLFFGLPTDNRGMHWLLGANGSSVQFGAFDNTSVSPSPNQNQFPYSEWKDVWTHVATVYDATTQRLVTYVNGIPKPGNTVTLLNLDPQGVLTIGMPPEKYSDEKGYAGQLDEVRLEKGIRSWPWIKANYEIQRQGSKLVVTD